MNWLEALILGIIQGITEFLPVSSSGHLVIGRELLGLAAADNIVFETVVHCGTVLSTITILRKDLMQLFIKLFKFEWNTETQYIAKIAISMIPVMIVGLFFKDQVEAFFGEGLLLVGAMLLLTATLLALTNLVKFKERKNVGWGSSLIIGIAQAVAVLPGLSRSGSTIATGLLMGVKKEEVAKFSFLMVLIPILGETFLGAVGGDFSVQASGIATSSLIIGFFASYIVGCFACKWMIELVKRANLIWFAIYCAIAGSVALIVGLL
jgi:undecaprenyl-diphosphatase